MNKSGKTSTLLTLGVVGVIVILGLLVYGMFLQGGGTQIVTDSSDGTVQVSSDCQIAPSITITTATDRLDSGTTVSVTPSYRVDGTYIGATTSGYVNKGSVVETLINASGYVDKILPPVTLKCGANTIVTTIDDYAAATVSVKTDAGTNILTDNAAGGAINETAFGVGTTKNWEITLTGHDKDVTGNTLYVVELGTPANVSSSSLSFDGVALPQVAIPSGLSPSGTDQYRVAYMIPSIENGVKKVMNLQVSTTSAGSVSGAVYTTFISGQAYVDSDGTFKVGTYNSLNSLKGQASYDYDWYVAAA